MLWILHIQVWEFNFEKWAPLQSSTSLIKRPSNLDATLISRNLGKENCPFPNGLSSYQGSISTHATKAPVSPGVNLMLQIQWKISRHPLRLQGFPMHNSAAFSWPLQSSCANFGDGMTNEMFSKMCRYPHSYWNNRLCPDAWRIISSEMVSSSHLRTFIL